MLRDRLQDRLANPDAVITPALIAVIVGAAVGIIVILFREAIDGASWLLRGTAAEGFEHLDPVVLFATPLVAALIIGAALTFVPAESRRVGVVHVLERLANHRGRIRPRSMLIQFFGGVVGLAGGLSGGREGPAIHLGAAISSIVGRALHIPNHIIRTMIACGSAAAIAGSFNTPLAGVIFAMEVIVMEYTIASFVPVIVAAVTATAITRFWFGNETTFSVPLTDLNTLLEVPYIGLAGVVVGLVGGLFILLVEYFARMDFEYWKKALVAGALTGVAAIVTPAVLGVGYDTVNEALLGNFAWSTLLIILLAKAVASAACVGLGLPVGMIGPTLVMGAVLGGMLGFVGQGLAPDEASQPAFYVMLGMAAMMAAVLQAPLAALIAVFELTENPNIIFPAMLIIVCATMTTRAVFNRGSIFIATLEALNVRYPLDPASATLSRTSVLSVVEAIDGESDDGEWTVEVDGEKLVVTSKNGATFESEYIGSHATLLEARDLMAANGFHPLVVQRRDRSWVGVVTQQAINDALTK